MSSSGSRKPLFVYLAPALLCVTALVQKYHVVRHHLNPWKGGGFGMFADVPSAAYRVLLITPVDSNSIAYVTPTPDGLRRQGRAVKMMPSRERVSAFARELVQGEWVLIGLERGEKQQYPVLKEEQRKHPSSRPIQIDRVIVEVLQYNFDTAKNEFQKSSLVKLQERREPR